jgi:hypothetical protein
MDLNHELFKNFTIGPNFHYNFDAEPLNTGGDHSGTTARFELGYQL